MAVLMRYEEFAEMFGRCGIVVDTELYSKFECYARLLCEWNEKINLTAITDPNGIAVKHFFDSIYPFTLYPPKESASVADIGTGAGFPGIPLKLYRGDISLTLIDSLNKRLKFLGEVSKSLDISPVLIHGRAEELARFTANNNLREQFDIATARAVARLRELCEYCLPFVKVGGLFYALKGKSGAEELHDAKNAIKLLGGKVKTTKEYTLSGGDERFLVVIEKIAPTPKKYPRNSGQIKKQPL